MHGLSIGPGLPDNMMTCSQRVSIIKQREAGKRCMAFDDATSEVTELLLLCSIYFTKAGLI